MFIWSLNPFLYALFLFLFDFGTVFALSIFFKGREKSHNFNTFWIGDTLLIPIMGYFSAVSLTHVDLATTYLGNPLWILIIVLFGYALIGFSEVLNFKYNRLRNGQPHQVFWLYHLAISGLMFLFVVGPLPLIFSLPGDPLPRLVIATCFVLFLCLIYIDFILPRKHKVIGVQ